MNRSHQNARRRRDFKPLLIATAMATSALPSLAGDFQLDGYLRHEMSWNTKDWEDTVDYDDKGRLSMSRTTVRINADWQITDALSLVTKLRASREYKTSFLEHLEDMGANSYDGGDIMELYDDEEIRELYIDWQLSDRLLLRLGKQQVVWGETDFFAANDLAHGFDNTWRTFLEPANEELRKANIIAKLNIDFPEVMGGLEMFVRPGWDRKEDIGTELDIYGARWSSQPTAGVDFRNIDPYNYENDEGDYRDVTGGVRWSAMWGNANYTVSYLKSFNPAPILNAADNLAMFGMPDTPSGATTQGTDQTVGVAGEIIYPIVDIFGFTASNYSGAVDAVFSFEGAYILDAPYQIYTGTMLTQYIAPGFDGYTNKDVMALMVRMDKNIAATQKWLGTEKPMFFSLQLFDKWVQDFDKDEELLYSVGWGGRVKEHSVLMTGIFGLSYNNGRIRPELVLGTDLSNGGGFAVPSVTFELGAKWRWKIEYDAFWDDSWRDGSKCTDANAGSCDDATLFGYFHNRDQFYTSLTYLF
jgi:hypothetical protein